MSKTFLKEWTQRQYEAVMAANPYGCNQYGHEWKGKHGEGWKPSGRGADNANTKKKDDEKPAEGNSETGKQNEQQEKNNKLKAASEVKKLKKEIQKATREIEKAFEDWRFGGGSHRAWSEASNRVDELRRRLNEMRGRDVFDIKPSQYDAEKREDSERKRWRNAAKQRARQK